MPYKLYSNCILTKGISRSSISDLQKAEIYLISNSLASKFNNDVISQYEDAAFIEFLLENRLVFEVDTDELSLFPKIPLDWDTPSKVTNAIVDFDKLTLLRLNLSYYQDFFRELDDLFCRVVVLRFFDLISVEVICEIVNLALSTKNISIELYVQYCEDIDRIASDYVKGHPRVRLIVMHGYNGEVKLNENTFQVVYAPVKIIDERMCGVVKDYYFSVNIDHYSEAQNHNTCLNRKISIDRRGKIKNCPSMENSFGTLGETKLVNVITDQNFQAMWNISKNQVLTCRDCEFRYICTDCRAFLERPDDIYSKPLKCGYDPIKCSWENWINDKAKLSAIAQYKLKEVYL